MDALCYHSAFCQRITKCIASTSPNTVVPRPLSNDPRFTQGIYRYSRASKRFVEVYMSTKPVALGTVFVTCLQKYKWL